MTDLLTRPMAAKTLCVSVATIDRMIAGGVLACVRIGRSVRLLASGEDSVGSIVASCGPTIPPEVAGMLAKKQSSGGRVRGRIFKRRRRTTAGVVEAQAWSIELALPGQKPVREATPFTRRDVAEKFLDQRRGELEAAHAALLAGIKASPWAGKSLAEIVDAIVARGGLKGSASPAWVANWKTTVMRGINACGWVKPQDITEHSWVDAWRGAALAGLSAKYRNEIRAAVRGLSARLLREKLIASDPLVDVARDRAVVPRRAACAMSIDELRMVLAAATPFRRAVYAVWYSCALRKSEMRRVRVEWFAREGGSLLLRLPADATKNGRAAVFRLALWAEACVEELAAGRSEGLLIEKPAKWWRVGLAQEWAGDVERAGLSVQRGQGYFAFLGSIRKTAATEAVMLCENVMDAKAMMRHSSVEMTLGVYARAGMTPGAELGARMPSPIVGGADVAGGNAVPYQQTWTAEWTGQWTARCDYDGDVRSVCGNNDPRFFGENGGVIAVGRDLEAGVLGFERSGMRGFLLRGGAGVEDFGPLEQWVRECPCELQEGEKSALRAFVAAHPSLRAMLARIVLIQTIA